MPYDGEYAGYRPVRRLVSADAVQKLLRRARLAPPEPTLSALGWAPRAAPPALEGAPRYVVGIDGSYSEVAVRNGYPGARVGYCTVASVLIRLDELDRLDAARPVDPRTFRDTEEAATIDAALPGSNVVTGNHKSPREAFRGEIFERLQGTVIDEGDDVALLDTYSALLAHKPQGSKLRCPYEELGCGQQVEVPGAAAACPCERSLVLYPTDALRIHERFYTDGPNGEAFGLVTETWCKILLVHFLRCFEKRGLLRLLAGVGFVLDGPLAVFGPPAWLSAAISRELKRLNCAFREQVGMDLLIFGVEKTGMFVTHFDEIDAFDGGGACLFAPRTLLLPTDRYIKSRVALSDSPKRYGNDTYFGRKCFYKTASGMRVVVNIPFLSEEQDTLDSGDPALYPRLGAVCALLDQLASSRYPNAVTPLVSAHAEAAIPLRLGQKVLQQLAKALIQGN